MTSSPTLFRRISIGWRRSPRSRARRCSPTGSTRWRSTGSRRSFAGCAPPVALSRAAGAAGARAHVHRCRGPDRIGAEDHPEPRVVAAALRRRPGRCGQGRASRLDGPALHDRGHHASRLLVLRDGRRRPRAHGRRRDQFWLPFAFTAAQRSDDSHAVWLLHIGRLGPGATIEQLRAQVDALNARMFARFPQFRFTELRVHGRHATPGSTHRHRPAYCICSGPAPVRAADWRAQHREPVARTRERARASWRRVWRSAPAGFA